MAKHPNLTTLHELLDVGVRPPEQFYYGGAGYRQHGELMVGVWRLVKPACTFHIEWIRDTRSCDEDMPMRVILIYTITDNGKIETNMITDPSTGIHPNSHGQIIATHHTRE